MKAAFALMAGLIASTDTAIATPARTPHAVTVQITDDGTTCGATTGTIAVPDLSVAGATNRLAASIPPHTEVHLTGVASVRYRCVGSLIFELQRRGVRRIGFISEPPAAADAN